MSFEFKWIRRVEFAETDLAGIMHFANFYRYMEMAEHAFYRSLGFSVHSGTLGWPGTARFKPACGWPGTARFKPACGWPRLAASCEFKRPLRFEDEVEVHLLVAEKSEKTIRYHFTFRNLSEDPPAEAARGSVTVVCARVEGGTLSAVAIPKEIDNLIEVAPPELLNKEK